MLIKLIGILTLVVVLSRIIVKLVEDQAEKSRIKSARTINQQEGVYCTLETLTTSIPRELIPPEIFRIALQEQTAIARNVMSRRDAPGCWAQRVTDSSRHEQLHRKGKLALSPPLSELADRQNARHCQETLLRNVRLCAQIIPVTDEQTRKDIKKMAVAARFRVPAEYHYQQGILAVSNDRPTDASFHFRRANEKLAGVEVDLQTEWHEMLTQKITRNTERLALTQPTNLKSRLEVETEALVVRNKPNLYDDSPVSKLSLQHKAGASL